VLKEEEKETIRTITERNYNKDKILQSWIDCDKKYYRETIRDIQSIDIVLIDLEKQRDKKIIPWQYETISVYKWSFISWAKQVLENKIDEADWIFGKAELSFNSCFDFEWQDKDTFLLKQLHIDEMKNHYDIIFVDNRYFDYTDAGLLVGQNENGEVSPIKQYDKEEKQTIIYKKDTFYQHNKGLLNCFETDFKPYLKFAFRELDNYWGEKTDWEQLIKIAICFHDYGKLNYSWQKIVKEFQRKKTGINDANEVLAHTDYDESADKELAKECGMKNKPPHAGIGAHQVYEMLYDLYSEKLAIAVANAILKHHSTETGSSDRFDIFKAGVIEIKKLMKEYSIEGELACKLSKENHLGIEIMPSQDIWLLYLYIVRILRLCDQKATESLEKYYKI
jgi:CRISPR-associated endonuclease/helicase Cas3